MSSRSASTKGPRAQESADERSAGHRVAPLFPWGRQLPLTGRRTDVNALRLALDDALDGRGHTLILKGEGGVGKTRLVEMMAVEARNRGFDVAIGRAFAVESSCPYGAVADALVPLVSALDASTLAVLARGAEGDLQALLPGLSLARGVAAERGFDRDLKARLHWNFAQFLQRLVARRPLLLVIENAHWCDPSSLELVHFLARQIGTAPLLLVVTYASDHPDVASSLRSVERSLSSLREATVRQVEPLTRQDVGDLLQRVLQITAEDAARHAAALHGHTMGNPFFLEETIKSLFASGLVRQVPGGWTLSELTDFVPPPSIRDAIRGRIAGMGEAAQRVAEIAAVIGTSIPLELLEGLAGLGAIAFADAVDELCSRRILVEEREGAAVHYEFVHPIVQSTVLGELTAARKRALHACVADEMIRMYGADAAEHTSEFVVHLAMGHASGGDVRALRFLARAGRDAMAKRADREAARWLGDALAIADRLADLPEARAMRMSLLEDLASARERIGEDSGHHWRRALDLARDAADDVSRSRILRRLGVSAAHRGRPAEALSLLTEAEAAAHTASRPDLAIRVRVAIAQMHQSLGRPEQAKRALLDVLPAAEELKDDALLARVHRTLLELHAWTGPGAVAREHGARALVHANASGDKGVAWSAHWAMAFFEGVSGNPAGVASHRLEAERLAYELRSPVLQAWTAEIAIEYASAVGDWSGGLALAERTIEVARAVAPHTLLPRLLVWTGLIVLARDEGERAREMFEEAWRLCRADEFAATPDAEVADVGNVHNVILAHTGMAAYHLSLGDWALAMEYGERGLALTDRYGYMTWAIHRLLPIIAECGIYTQQFERVEEVAIRLRRQSQLIGHRLGLALAGATDALVLRFRYQRPDAAALLLASADELEAVPFVFHAARLRRNAAQLLEADGQIESAVRELRRAHDQFARLGAEFELRGTRSQLRSLGVRLPPRTTQTGAGTLTGRELEIARCIARRQTNKEVARTLGISARTVSTHLSHIFEKLGVDSRGALADVMRDNPLFVARDE